MRVALTIAGMDSGGGAGVAADLKTFEAHGVWGTCAVTAVTAQNTLGVQAVEGVPADVVRAQVQSVAADIGVDAVKTGMLWSAGTVLAVAESVARLGLRPLVVDPVLASGHGDGLLDDAGLDAVREHLLPLATVVTPNLAEAAALLGREPIADRDDMVDAGKGLVGLGASLVMLTGGHLPADDAPDLLAFADGSHRWLEAPRLASPHGHGSGCVLSAAITAELARGMDPADACVAAKRFVTRAIAGGIDIGAGVGPVDPGWERKLEGGTA